MAGNTNLSPRQRMINLMYIVLTAMLALNVSSDVLHGFKLVEEGLVRSTQNATNQNSALYQELEESFAENPQKSGEWYRKAMQLHAGADSLYTLIQNLKWEIVRDVDGEKGDVTNIRGVDNLDAAPYIMLTQGKGEVLRNTINSFRERAMLLSTDAPKQRVLSHYLSTDVPESAAAEGKNWEEAMFEGMPVAAAITLLTKIQNDLRFAEGELLYHLISNIDSGDMRVNRLNAFVIPASKHIIRGGSYSANIVLAAIDSTQQPTIYIENKPLDSNQEGLYEVNCNSTGNFTYNGYLEVRSAGGVTSQYPFSNSYTVVEPSATVSATLMNVLYAGISNPLSISVPGVASQQISASMSGGSLTRQGNGWVAKPTQVGGEAVITVTATVDGRSQVVSRNTFKVRRLPDPLPFLAYKDEQGVEQHYRGGKPLSKALLLSAGGLSAAIDDGILNVSYRVLGFETILFDSMGNAMPELSNGANFSERQMTALRRLSRGKRFFISRVRAVGPDGIERDLSPLEVIVN